MDRFAMWRLLDPEGFARAVQHVRRLREAELNEQLELTICIGLGSILAITALVML